MLRERFHFEETPEETLQRLRHSLLIKYPNNQMEITAQDKIKLKNAIMKIQYPYALKDILVLVNKETTDILDSSLHPLLKELGKKCKKFYTDDPLNKFVQPETGIVVANRGGLSFSWSLWNFSYSYTGQAVWDLSKNAWKATPGSSGYSSYNGGVSVPAEEILGHIVQGLGYLPDYAMSMYYANFTKTPPIKLISPLHIAALIDDEGLLKHLISQGVGTCQSEQEDIIGFMFEKGGSFASFEKLVNRSLIITDEVLKIALQRDAELHAYLNIKRSMDVQSKIKQEGSNKALKTILNYSPIPIKSLVEVILTKPEMIHQVEGGNILLHQLVIAKEVTKVTALLEAIFQASFSKKIGVFVFNIDLKNKEKTILDLALEQKDKILISAILMYNPKLSKAQQDKIVEEKIDIPAIHQEKEKRMRYIVAQQSQESEEQGQQIEVLKRSQIIMSQELLKTKQEIFNLMQMNGFLMEKLELMAVALEQLGLQPFQAQDGQRRFPDAFQLGNPNRLFAIENAKPNPDDVILQQNKQVVGVLK